jgi:hypothetical protein
MVRAPRAPVYKFRRVFQEVFTGSATGVVAYSPAVTLGGLPSSAEFTSLFSEYRIAKITVLFRPDSSLLSVSNPYPTVNTVFEYTNSTALTGVTAAQQYLSWKQTVFSSNRPVMKIVYMPNAMQSGVLTASGGGTEKLSRGTFFDTSNTGILFFGLKTIWEGVSTTQAVNVSLIVDVELRGVK